MLKAFRMKPVLLTLCVAAAMAPWTSAGEVPVYHTLPKYQTPVPYTGERNWHVTQNLGPTGVRGWVHGHGTNTLQSREILVKSVEPGSPADGVLRPYDIIVGAAVPPDTPASQWRSAPVLKRFDSDARLALARAITWAESDRGRGELKLLCVRDGRSRTVVIELPVLGTYGPTAPFDCPKSQRIVDSAAEFLAEKMPVGGFAAGVPTPLNAALLLATGNDAYLDHVRRSACRMSINHTVSDAGHETWRWGNTNVFLCEYYLATGDRRVLPTIREYCRVLAAGQCNPGTWGHKGVPDFIPPGYGSLNASGVVCFLSLVLADQCGVEVDEKALRNSIRFYGSYAGRGGIPYGDHPPSYNATSNGKNGMAAVAFGLLGAEPAAQWFACLSCSANLHAFEGGHTGNFFNQTWSPLGAGLAGRENYIRFWSRFNSYRDLARRWDGSFMTQPYPNTREGDLGTGNYVAKGPMWSTGGFALSYLAGNDRLAILGRSDSVFGANAPAELKDALDLYHGKNFEDCARAAAKLESVSDPRVRRMAKQLTSAARSNLASIVLTLADMGKALETGDLYKLKWQLQAVASIVDADDERLEAFRAAVEDPANHEILDSGAVFHAAVAGVQWSGPAGFQVIASGPEGNGRMRGTLEGLASRGKGCYRDAAKAYLAAHPALRLAPNTSLIPPARPNATCWRLMPPGEAPDAWNSPSFKDAAWKPLALPSDEVGKEGTSFLRGTFDVEDPAAIQDLYLEYLTAGPLKVYLNGTLIIHLAPESPKTPWKSPVVLLKPATRELLKKGTNCLAVMVVPPTANGGFDLALKAITK